MKGSEKSRKSVSFPEVPIDHDEGVFTTGVVSRLLGIPYHVLKQLDKEGIVSPPRVHGKIRLYSKRDVEKLQHCWIYIKEKRVRIQGLKVILEMERRQRKGA